MKIIFISKLYLMIPNLSGLCNSALIFVESYLFKQTSEILSGSKLSGLGSFHIQANMLLCDAQS